MNFKKLAPWNWFKEEESTTTLPIKHTGQVVLPRKPPYGPIAQLQQEMDQLFDNFFKGFAQGPVGTGSFFPGSLSDNLLKPTLDIGATEKEYTISIEVPGVEEKDVTLEIADNTLTIKGEKEQEREEKEKHYYRMERSYGSFQRLLSLPEDADQDAIKATFKNGVVTITMPRKALPQSEVKQIKIK
ncbi:MAG: Hsp20/alpha crystallin family protein [Proteobacteria bacterium]|nr:Hsp20/alpha crystallin family protein [Pseudomonadota bacterium]MBU1137467.1 Hsp20/alpha crystallin family protein [Pseudomonadota bacterium]MBU1234211.1 Hsp20/alpha crystallin family protein [Pseudomonadota bacterium]MBU1419885.1 Hsp20/alpha crystallin family protein [Pseudomonadota bacterium]MBU1453312.1 Hsp20/alpha crystallin family protein [Pseudomonadota bacterium]